MKRNILKTISVASIILGLVSCVDNNPNQNSSVEQSLSSASNVNSSTNNENSSLIDNSSISSINVSRLNQ